MRSLTNFLALLAFFGSSSLFVNANPPLDENTISGEQDGNSFQERQDPYGDLDFGDVDDDVEAGSDGEEYDGDLVDDFHTSDFEPSHVFTFEISKSREECFYESIESPIKIRGAYFVSSADSGTISLEVKRENTPIKSVSRQSQAVFSINADKAGTYSFCFYATAPSETVTFAIHVGVRVVEHVRRDHLTPLESSIRSMHRATGQLIGEQNFLVIRTKAHMETQDAMESRVAWYTLLETLFMGAVTACQVYYTPA